MPAPKKRLLIPDRIISARVRAGASYASVARDAGCSAPTIRVRAAAYAKHLAAAKRRRARK